MNEITIDLDIYSPRWGHDDTYTVLLSREYMTISMSARVAKCEWREGLDPEWNKHNTLEDIMNNDSIYPPTILPSLFEQVWKAWRDGELNQEQASNELQALAEWLNIITKAKPKTDFWNMYF